MTLALVSPDRFVRHAPLGLMFRDASDRSLIGDGLEIDVADAKRPARTTRLLPTPSGTWMTPRLPGLDAALAQQPADWPGNMRAYDVTVSDALARFLPMRLTLDLPVQGRVVWGLWGGFNQARIRPLMPADPPLGYAPDYLPLFPAIARTAPGPRVTVRAQLAIRQPDGSDLPASWATMTVSVANRIVALGVAGVNGAIVASGAYPNLPVQTAKQAAAGRTAITWDATIRVYYAALAGDPPALPAILGQLSGPATTALAKLAPGDPPLPVQPLTLGRPLTLATMRTATERFSSLYLKPI